MSEQCPLSGTMAQPPRGASPSQHDCSWQDVLESIDIARGEYDLKMLKNGTLCMQRNRALAVSLELLADMIPDQDGLSVLRGGLKFLFKVDYFVRLFSDAQMLTALQTAHPKTH
jgi:hypothetical protein